MCLQKLYRSDLNWMKGVGWEASKSLDVQQAKKAGDLVSEVIMPESLAGQRMEELVILNT